MTRSFTLWSTGILTAGILLLSGCGGGGSSTASVVEASTVITADNVDVVTAGAVGSVAAGDSQIASGTTLYALNTGSETSASAAAMVARLLAEASDYTPTYLRGLETRDTVTESCTDGGTVSSTSDETSETLVFSQCSQNGYTMDGSLTIQLIDASHEKYTATDLTMTGPDFSADYKDVVVDVTYDTDDNISRVDATLTADFTFTTDQYGMQGTYRYDRFHMTVSNMTNPPMAITVEGLVSTPCTGGWVELKTAETIEQPDYDSCPTAGRLEIYGAESTQAEARFNSDGSVDVTFEGETTHYNSCYDLEAACSGT